VLILIDIADLLITHFHKSNMFDFAIEYVPDFYNIVSLYWKFAVNCRLLYLCLGWSKESLWHYF